MLEERVNCANAYSVFNVATQAQGLLHPVTTFLMLNTKKEVIYILKGNGSK